MKRFLASFLILNVFFVLALGALAFLAETYPLRPGDSFFGLQQAAER